MKRVVPLLALLALVAGCGEKDDVLEPSGSKQVTLMLDYFPNADHAGIYAAQAAGDFKQAGLDVEIRQPADPAAPIKQVAAGRVDVAISYEPELLRARDEGLSVVSIGALVRKPLTSIISLPEAKIRKPADLRGKTVGTAGIDYQSAYLETILDEASVPRGSVKERNVGFGLTPALLTGKVDAVLGAFWNYEGVELELKGKRPRIIRMEQAGVPTYDELVLVAKREQLEADPQAIRLFIAALARGTTAAVENPKAAANALLEANPDLDPKLAKAELAATLPLLDQAAAGDNRPYGYMAPDQWREFSGWMRDNELIDGLPATSSLLSNDYLPGAIPE
jgi:putative hydroxymethylpyrimidine transport system substrate-binding protein